MLKKLLWVALVMSLGSSSTAWGVEKGTPPLSTSKTQVEATADGKPVSYWVGQLADPQAETRRKAAEELIKIGEPAYPALANFLNTFYKPEDPNNEALKRAAATFAEIGDPAVPALLAVIRLIDQPDGLRHSGGLMALTQMGAAGFPALGEGACQQG